MDCLACGAENNENAKFCRKCGAVIHPAETPENSCPVCQAALKNSARFCQKCGHSLGIVSSATAFPPTAPAQSKTGASVPEGANPADVVDQIGETKPCPSCENPLKPTAKFCGKCGFSFVSDKQPEPAESAQSASKLPSPAMANASAVPPASNETVIRREADLPVDALRSSGLPDKLPPGTQSGKNTAIIGAIALLLCAIAGGGYWWFAIKAPAGQSIQAAQPGASPPPAASAEMAPGEPARLAATAAANMNPPAPTGNPGDAVKGVPQESKQAGVNVAATEKPKHSAPPASAQDSLSKPAKPTATMQARKSSSNTPKNQGNAASEVEQERKRTGVNTAMVDESKGGFNSEVQLL